MRVGVGLKAGERKEDLVAEREFEPKAGATAGMNAGIAIVKISLVP